MTEQADAINFAVDFRRGRPWLLSYNRRLRHVNGITIRNLTLNEHRSRPQATSLDDEALPQTLNSPAKILAQQEQRTLEHSRSSTDLRPIQELNPGIESKKVAENGALKTPTRPAAKRLRRRSTMEWASASPLARQKRLEDVTNARMVDVFFTLHVEGEEDPIYISETSERTMNPNFRFFDLGSAGAYITRLDSLVVQVWAKTDQLSDFQLLLKLELNLRYLQFIGKTIESFRQPLPQNCVLFHLTDGVYTILTAGAATETSLQGNSRQSNSNRVLPTSSYDALMRLSTLDVCIQDALITRERLEAQINQILDESKGSLDTVNGVDAARQTAEVAEHAVDTEKRRLETTRKRCENMKNSIRRRKEQMGRGRDAQSKTENDISTAENTLTAFRESLQKTGDDMHGQRRRICEDLLRIYPIEPIEGRPLTFTIRGLQLPNSEFDDANGDEVAAALGHVAQVVHLLSSYLSVPLPYPLHPRGSTSSILDPISLSTGTTNYPLFTKSTARFRFEYAVFLLNKDIEVLSNHIGLRVMDLRQTLPNLKYLLYIATAGTGELPARKAGGLRAFLRNGAGSPAILSRRGSDESAASADGKRVPAPIAPDGSIPGGGGNDFANKLNGKPFAPGVGRKYGALKSSRLRDGG